METLEQSKICRLCGKQTGISFDIFDKNENYAKKINAVLPILVHEMDLLPKQMCYCCNCKLKEFHKFYEDCLKTDSELKSQLSWMQPSEDREEINDPMVLITNTAIKTEPFVYDEKEFTNIDSDIEKLSNIAENNCANDIERISPDSLVRCTNCGCNCGNANRINENIDNKYSDTTDRRNDDASKNVNGENTKRESIKKNLFATQIFADKNLRVQTEIPICSIPMELMDHEVLIEGVNSNTDLERLNVENNVKSTKENTRTNDENVTVARTLKSRKSFTEDASTLFSLLKESKNKINDESNRKETRLSDSESDAMELKLARTRYESSEEADRTLRPRTEGLNYSELRKIHLCSRTSVFSPGLKNNDQNKKRMDSHDSSRDLKSLFRKIALKRRRSTEMLESPIDVVNFDENDTSSILRDNLKVKECTNSRNNIKINENNGAKRKRSSEDDISLLRSKKKLKTCASGSKKKKLPVFAIENFIKNISEYKDKKRSSIVNRENKTKRNFHYFTGRKCLIEITKNKMAAERKSKKSRKNQSSGSSCCRKNKNNYRRIEHPTKFDVNVKRSKELRRKNELQNSTTQMTIRKMLRAQRECRGPRRSHKRYDCYCCNSFFDSKELYKLHACYNLRRH